MKSLKSKKSRRKKSKFSSNISRVLSYIGVFDVKLQIFESSMIPWPEKLDPNPKCGSKLTCELTYRIYSYIRSYIVRTDFCLLFSILCNTDSTSKAYIRLKLLIVHFYFDRNSYEGYMRPRIEKFSKTAFSGYFSVRRQLQITHICSCTSFFVWDLVFSSL